MLKNDQVMKDSTEKLFMFMIEKGLGKNQALAIVGNSLIDAHNNPYLEPQKVVLPIVGAAALQGLRACAMNPACARVITSGLIAAGSALKMTIDEVGGAKTFWTPEADKIKPMPGFAPAEDKPEMEGFDWFWEKYNVKIPGFEATQNAPDLEGFDVYDKVGPNIFFQDNAEKFKWEVKDPKDASKVGRDQRFGNIYKDPTQKIGNKQIWWSKDLAQHGGSKYKLFVERGDRFEWFADVDEKGSKINKHKSDVGRIIFKKDVKWRN